MRDSIELCLGMLGEDVKEIGIHVYFAYFNAVICLFIAGRLMTYQRNGANNRVLVSISSWLIVSASLASAALTFTGKYMFVHPSEIVINVAFCVAIWCTKGNLAKICRPL